LHDNAKKLCETKLIFCLNYLIYFPRLLCNKAN
jgi:hypothetical protein